MSLPKSLNKFVTRAQVNHPVLAGKVIRKLTGSGGKSASPSSGAASTAADQPTVLPLNRDNGIEAAKLAAGVPAAL